MSFSFGKPLLRHSRHQLTKQEHPRPNPLNLKTTYSVGPPSLHLFNADNSIHNASQTSHGPIWRIWVDSSSCTCSIHIDQSIWPTTTITITKSTRSASGIIIRCTSTTTSSWRRDIWSTPTATERTAATSDRRFIRIFDESTIQYWRRRGVIRFIHQSS